MADHQAEVAELTGLLRREGVLRAVWYGPRFAGLDGALFRDVSLDLDSLGPGSLYVNTYGVSREADRRLEEAVRRGAVAVCAETPPGRDRPIPTLEITDPWRVASRAAALLYGSPSRRLRAIGVTGTAGKTTTCAMITRCLERAGMLCALRASSLEKILDQLRRAAMTTPGSPELQRFLADAVTAGAEVAIVEVSSHGLFFQRVADVRFEIGVLTGIAHEHTDLHATLDHYVATKARLFQSLPRTGFAIFIEDSENTLRTVEGTPARRISVGRGPTADVGIDEGAVRVGSRVAALVGREATVIPLRLHTSSCRDRENAALAAATAFVLGVPERAIEDALATFPGLPRCMQVLYEGPFRVVDNDKMGLGPFPEIVEDALRGQFAQSDLVLLTAVRGAGGVPKLAADDARGVSLALRERPRCRVVATASAEWMAPPDLPDESEIRAFLGELIRSGVRPKFFLNLKPALEEAIRVVRPGGTILLGGAKGLDPAAEVLRQLLERPGGRNGTPGRWIAPEWKDLIAEAVGGRFVEPRETV